jgi:hypothetical protein
MTNAEVLARLLEDARELGAQSPVFQEAFDDEKDLIVILDKATGRFWKLKVRGDPENEADPEDEGI